MIVAVLDMVCVVVQAKPAGPEVVGVCANHTCVAEGGSSAKRTRTAASAL